MMERGENFLPDNAGKLSTLYISTRGDTDSILDYCFRAHVCLSSITRNLIIIGFCTHLIFYVLPRTHVVSRATSTPLHINSWIISDIACTNICPTFSRNNGPHSNLHTRCTIHYTRIRLITRQCDVGWSDVETSRARSRHSANTISRIKGLGATRVLYCVLSTYVCGFGESRPH